MLSVAKQLVPTEVIDRKEADVFCIEPVAYYFTACLRSSVIEQIEMAIDLMTFVEAKCNTRSSIAHKAYSVSKAAFETQSREAQVQDEDDDHTSKFKKALATIQNLIKEAEPLLNDHDNPHLENFLY